MCFNHLLALKGQKVTLDKDQIILQPNEKFFYISSGIAEGDRYCATAVEQPLPGMKVRISS